MSASAQIASDNLTDSTDLGLITDSFIAGAFTGISSLDDSSKLSAIGVTLETVIGLIGKFPDLLTANSGSSQRSASKTADELIDGIPNTVAKEADKANAPGGGAAVALQGAQSVMKGVANTLGPAKAKEKAATIAEKVIESAANLPGVTAEIAKKIYEEAASKVVKGVDESGKVSGSEMQELAKETAGKATAIMQTAKASLEAAAGVTLSEDDLQSAISGLQTLVNTVISESENLTKEEKQTAIDDVAWRSKIVLQKC